MNKILSAFFLFTFFIYSFTLFTIENLFSQTYYNMSSGNYTEDFSDISNVTNWPNGFGGPSSEEWGGLPVNENGTIPDGIRITNQTNVSFSTGASTGVQRGSENIQLLTTGTTDNSTAIAIELYLNFSGRDAGTFSFDAGQVNNSTGNRVSTLRLFYSLDGINYTEITGGNLPFSATNNADPVVTSNISVSLPSAISNQPQVRLRFYCHNGTGGSSGSRPKISMDNILVTSLSDIQFDLRLKSFTITPQQPMIGDNLNLDLVVDNLGTNIATDFSLNIYYDENRNGIPDPNELINTQSYPFLNPGDSLLKNLVIQDIDSGFKQYIGVVDFPADQDTSNNKLTRFVNVGGPPVSTSDIVVNEIMYAPTDATNEWYEIYNRGEQPVNIKNWKWRDLGAATLREITTNDIFIMPDGFLVVCQDSVKFRTRFPNITGTYMQSIGWSILNNTGDDGVILYNAAGVLVDSVIYNNSWGGQSGVSLERKLADAPSNDQNNWGSSIAIDKATPNRINSITPKDFDIALTTFNIEPLFPASGETVRFDFVIKNPGLNAAQNFTLNIYNDINFDSIPDPGELLNSNNFANLNAGDSVSYSYSIPNIDSGYKQYIALLVYPPDEDTSNNKIVRNINVGGDAGGNFVINEIMFDPLVGQSEWIELYNATGQSINIRNYRFVESSNIFRFSPDEDYFINPGDFIAVAHDTSIFERYSQLRDLEPNQHLFFMSSMSLSNTGEALTFTDSLGNILDQVDYRPNWKNPNIPDPKGISLERINPRLGSNDAMNWSSSADPLGGTPGRRNSIFTPDLPSTGTVTISPNPFSPDGDGHEDFTIIKYKLTVPFAQMRVKVFDIKGRLVRSLANNQVTANEGTIIFDGLSDNGERLRIGIYILYIEAIDDRGGQVDVIKAPVVVAAKL